MRVLAELRLLPDDEGRARMRRGEYRPNHDFGSPEDRERFIGQIEIPDGEEIWSGEMHRLVVDFFAAPKLRAIARPGSEWRLQEGNTVVGTARILEILDQRWSRSSV